MKRYEHWITPSSPGRGPERVVCLGTETDYGYCGDKSRIGRVGKWFSVDLSRDKEGRLSDPASTSEGSGGMGLSEYLASLHCRRGEIWIVHWTMGRLLSQIGMWELIDNKSVTLGGKPAKSKQAEAKPRKPAHHYGPVIADPPTIVDVSYAMSGQRLKLLDARNWGLSLSDQLLPAWRQAEDIATAVRSMDRALSDCGLGPLKSTAGSQAMHSWRRTLDGVSILAHTHSSASQIESDGYYGGRCECGRLGLVEGPLYYLDMRSCYGRILASRPLPARLVTVLPGDRALALGDRLSQYHRIARVEIETERPDYPVRLKDRVVYPVGRYWTTLHEPELLHAEFFGRVLRYGECSLYERQPIGSEYAKRILGLLDADPLGKYPMVAGWLKGLLVSLAGKWGQKVRPWEPGEYGHAPGPYCYWWRQATSGEWRRSRSLSWHVEHEGEPVLAYDALPQAAGAVTSYARTALLSLMDMAGRDHCVYWDTDGVIVDEAGLVGVGHAGGMDTDGVLSARIKARYSWTEILGIKWYVWDSGQVCSGAPKGEITPAGNGTDYWRWPSTHGQVTSRKRPSPEEALYSYSRRAKYRHGIVEVDGSVSPITFPEEVDAKTEVSNQSPA